MITSDNIRVLTAHLPHNTFEILAPWLNHHYVALKIAGPRTSKLGDYRPVNQGKQHMISVNGSLNQYAFFLTLVHEIAHMHNYIAHGSNVKPHGPEWKHEFKNLMGQFELKSVFPEQLLPSIENYINNPKASTGSDTQLSLALRNYDDSPEHTVVISEIIINSIFITRNGRKFIRGAKQRKRYKCREVKSGRLYLFSPITEVTPV